LGNLGEDSSTGDFERRLKEALGKERLRGGALGGELLHWGPWKICSEILWIWASLSIGDPIVPRGCCVWGGGLVYRGL